MLRTPKPLLALLLLLPLVAINALGNNPADDDVYDDYIPEQSARVARIKILEGNAQIKRAESEDWERAVENLPLVEGDEIVTEENTRIEIQFDRNNYLRLAEKSYLKIINLQDEGIAVSLSQGTLNLTILEFDKDKQYFEVDAPRTTVAFQKAGKYRIDAGDEYKKEVRVAVDEWGEARVYSNDSGFTLKNGRTATLFLDGDYAGEWDTRRNSRYDDDFDKWTAERDAVIERRIRNANDRKYYDDSIYGADELNDYGEWVYARDYGYVWRPYGNSISRYSNWSPYRYGHWRWLPYYGWTWVNDEPWGWATYHHGRWFYYNGYWVWSPYSRYYRTRSYWRPAIVFITYIGDSYCWYPLPYHYRYYNYNYGYRNRWRRYRRNNGNDGNGGPNNPPNNPPATPTIPPENIARANRNRNPRIYDIPRTGVVSISKEHFGRDTKGIRRPPISVADEVLKKQPVIADSPPIIPSYKDLDGKVSKEILIPNTRREPVIKREVKIGATERTEGKPLDEKLQRKTIYGNRVPRNTQPPRTDNGNGTTVETKTPRTGVFDRTKRPPANTPDTNRPNDTTTPRSNNPQRTPTPPRRPANPNRSDTETKQPEPRTSPPIYTPPTRNDNERKSSPPVYRRPQPRREAPRPAPPPRSEPKPPPPPSRNEPKRDSPPPSRRGNPAPPPKSESKPPANRSESKDNR